MVLTTVPTLRFADYYRALVCREIPLSEKLNNVIREECSKRRRIQNEQATAFRDVLHIVGHWIGEKKAGTAAFFGSRYVSLQEYTMWKKEREIWFPPIEPRTVPVKCTPLIRGYPYAKVTALLNEEKELRTWLEGVETQQMKRIVRSKDQQLHLLKCEILLQQREARERLTITKDEVEIRASLKKKVFLGAPPAFFIQQLRERFGGTAGIQKPPTLEETEEIERRNIEEEETNGWLKIARIPQDIFEKNVFVLHHQEVVQREEIIQEEAARVYEIIAHACRATFGLYHYHTPAMVLHVDPPRCPLLAKMVKATAVVFSFKEDGRNRKKDKSGVGLLSQKRGTVAPSSLLSPGMVREEEKWDTPVDTGKRSSSLGQGREVEEDEEENERSMERKTTATGESCVPMDPYFACSPSPVPQHMKLPVNPSWEAIDEEEANQRDPFAWGDILDETEELPQEQQQSNFTLQSVVPPPTTAAQGARKARELQERRLRSIGCSAILRRDSIVLNANGGASLGTLHGSKAKLPFVKHAKWTTLSAVPEKQKTLLGRSFSSSSFGGNSTSPFLRDPHSGTPSRGPFVPLSSHKADDETPVVPAISPTTTTPSVAALPSPTPATDTPPQQQASESASHHSSNASSTCSTKSSRSLPPHASSQSSHPVGTEESDAKPASPLTGSLPTLKETERKRSIKKGEGRGEEGTGDGAREHLRSVRGTGGWGGEPAVTTATAAALPPLTEPPKKTVVKMCGVRAGGGGGKAMPVRKSGSGRLSGTASASTSSNSFLPLITKYPPPHLRKKSGDIDSEIEVDPWMKTKKYKEDAARLPPVTGLKPTRSPSYVMPPVYRAR